jgi:hypothetical protein
MSYKARSNLFNRHSENSSLLGRFEHLSSDYHQALQDTNTSDSHCPASLNGCLNFVELLR